MKQILITVGETEIRARLRDTPTAEAIYANLPIESDVRTWGEEIYFPASLDERPSMEPDARDVVDAGELAYWLEGDCIAIGFGPTPISQGVEIRLAARTNIWADALDSLRPLKTVQAGEKIRVEAAA